LDTLSLLLECSLNVGTFLNENIEVRVCSGTESIEVLPERSAGSPPAQFRVLDGAGWVLLGLRSGLFLPLPPPSPAVHRGDKAAAHNGSSARKDEDDRGADLVVAQAQ
jgi:hypothetical protein